MVWALWLGAEIYFCVNRPILIGTFIYVALLSFPVQRAITVNAMEGGKHSEEVNCMSLVWLTKL